MSRSIAIQMDPLASIVISADSSYRIGLEACRRGYRVFHYTPDQLSLSNDDVIARVTPVTFQDKEPYIQTDEPITVSLSECDMVFMRQNPPFDMEYITATYLLERLPSSTLVVNNPIEVRNAPEKLFIFDFPSLIPPTLITRNDEEVTSFYAEHEDIVLKPLYVCGGQDVFHIQKNDDNFETTVESLLRHYTVPLIAQKFLSDVSLGDKRIILFDGEPVAAINRVPPEGKVRSNMIVGGVAEKTNLTERDQEICDAIGPVLRQKGLLFAGIDVIGLYLTEINVTSPTGFASINALEGRVIEAEFFDMLEAKLQPLKQQKTG